jgi:hypothetical protein
MRTRTTRMRWTTRCERLSLRGKYRALQSVNRKRPWGPLCCSLSGVLRPQQSKSMQQRELQAGFGNSSFNILQRRRTLHAGTRRCFHRLASNGRTCLLVV